MAEGFFGELAPVRYEGPASDNALCYRHYEASRLVHGKTMAEHLRPAVCYWHNFAWMGSDMFGAPTFERPWAGETMAAARVKADAAFDMFALLGVPFFTFHDRDVVPEGANFQEFAGNLARMVDVFAAKMQASGVKLLWGTANLFSHPRYMAGAATNPDPDVFAYAAAQVKNAIDATHRLDGANYVLWGGREGYETLLNTDLDARAGPARPVPVAGRRLQAQDRLQGRAAGRAQAAGADQAPIRLRRRRPSTASSSASGWRRRSRSTSKSATRCWRGHSFEHEIATAAALGVLGSVDANRNDYQSGWDTDQFPNNAAELVPAFYHILKAGGIAPGGFNFDAKVRRQSIDPVDLLYGHIGGLDACALALEAAARLIEDGKYDAYLAQRYAGWDAPEAKAMLAPGRLARRRSRRASPRRRSSRSRAPGGRNSWRICSTAFCDRKRRPRHSHLPGVGIVLGMFLAMADAFSCSWPVTSAPAVHQFEAYSSVSTTFFVLTTLPAASTQA